MDKNQQLSIQLMQVFSLILVFCIGGIVVADGVFDKKIVPSEKPVITTSIQQITAPVTVPESKTEEKAPLPTPAKKIPPSVTLAVPFYMQAPDNKRVLPWTEACSEANIVLAAYYIQDKTLTKDQFKQDILTITKVQNKFFGTYIEIPIAELQTTYDRFYPNAGKTKIIENPTIQQIKEELAQGHVIISPSAGKILHNPYYLENPPRFHTLLIRGYDDKYFYTNDVGISR